MAKPENCDLFFVADKYPDAWAVCLRSGEAWTPDHPEGWTYQGVFGTASYRRVDSWEVAQKEAKALADAFGREEDAAISRQIDYRGY